MEKVLPLCSWKDFTTNQKTVKKISLTLRQLEYAIQVNSA